MTTDYNSTGFTTSDTSSTYVEPATDLFPPRTSHVCSGCLNPQCDKKHCPFCTLCSVGAYDGRRRWDGSRWHDPWWSFRPWTVVD